MTENASGLRKDVTVVLLGHAEPGFRARAAHYHQGLGVACVALDEALPTLSGEACTQRLQGALAQVASPFVALALDADFLLAAALDAAVGYLRAHPDCRMAQGHVLGYNPGNSVVEYYKVGSALEAPRSQGVRGVLEQYANAGQSAWRAVVRVDALQGALDSLPAGLSFDAWLIALSYALLAQGSLARLDQTDAVSLYTPSVLTQVERDERVASTVRLLRQWDAEQLRLCADDDGFSIINELVRNTFTGGEDALLFTSQWGGMTTEPERNFEPRQFVSLPYYNAPLFECLTDLEFLLHAWPSAQGHQHAVEGTWVSQLELLGEHPNDNAESQQARYWQALSLSLFNPEVCRRLASTLTAKADAAKARELREWMARLDALPGIDPRAWLSATASGQVLQAIAAATPDAAAQQRIAAHLGKQPAAQIAFVVVDLEDDDTGLQTTFDSLLASGLRDFKLVVLKAGELPAITTARDTLHFIQVSASNLVSHLNKVVQQLPSEWLMVLRAGDMLTTGGLLRLQVELASAPGCQAISANEVQRDKEGRLVSVVREGGNLDLLRSRPDLMAQHWLVRRQAVLDLGGYSDAHPKALEFDLLLRLIEQSGLGCLAHMDEYLVIGQAMQAEMASDALSTLNRHLALLGYRGQVSDTGGGRMQVDFRHQSTPLVSILVAAEEDLEDLKLCLVSVLQRTRYPRYELLVACREAATEKTAAALQGFGTRVKLLSGAQDESRAGLINLAAVNAKGEYLAVLSSHSQVVTPAWIEALLNHAQRPEVGVVGARLIDRHGASSHAGYALLEGARVQAPWVGLSTQASERALWPAVVRSCAAVSADCLMVRKAVFEHCDGLQDIAGADIELCLQVAEAGLLVIWTPLAQVFNEHVVQLQAAQAQAIAARWPGAFSSRVEIDSHSGVDVSRSGATPLLEWLADLS